MTILQKVMGDLVYVFPLTAHEKERFVRTDKIVTHSYNETYGKDAKFIVLETGEAIEISRPSMIIVELEQGKYDQWAEGFAVLKSLTSRSPVGHAYSSKERRDWAIKEHMRIKQLPNYPQILADLGWTIG